MRSINSQPWSSQICLTSSIGWSVPGTFKYAILRKPVPQNSVSLVNMWSWSANPNAITLSVFLFFYLASVTVLHSEHYITFELTPTERYLFFMRPHIIRCTYTPHFAPYDRIYWNVTNLVDNVDYVRGPNLTMVISKRIYLYDTVACVTCASNYPNMKTEECYQLVGWFF